MRIIKVRFRNGEDFLAQYLADLDGGGVFFATREAIPVGTPVIVEIRFPELKNRTVLQGSVAWRRPGRHSAKIRAGVGIQFALAEMQKRDYVLAIARGEQQDAAARRHKRLPIHLPVSWRVAQEKGVFDSIIADIGPGGAFVQTPSPAPLGEDVVLDICAPGAERPISIAGRVVWASDRTERAGFGMEFRWRDAGGARRLKELVRRIERGASPRALAPS